MIDMDRQNIYLCLSALAICLFWSSYFLMWQGTLAGNEPFHYASRVMEILVCFLIAFSLARHASNPGLLARAALLCEIAALITFPFSPVMSGLLAGSAAGLFAPSALLLLAHFPTRNAQLAFIFAILSAHVLSVACSLLPAPAFVVVRDVSLCGGLIVLVIALSLTKDSMPSSPATHGKLTSIRELRILLLGMMLFALLCGFASQIFLEKGVELGLANPFVELSSILLLFLLLAACLLLRSVTLDMALLVVLSFFAIVLLVSSFLYGGQTTNMGVFIRGGFDVYQVMVWVAFIERTHRDPVREGTFFALSIGMLRTCVISGRLAATGASLAFAVGTLDSIMLALLSLWLIATIALLFHSFALHRKTLLLPPLEQEVAQGNETHFEQRSSLLAQHYRLSVRETEVFEHFVHGRSASHIAKSLFISDNTVKTHLRRIYQKADVHSRQELLDKIDRIDDIREEGMRT